jgi:regulator of RNase E activity RraA
MQAGDELTLDRAPDFGDPGNILVCGGGDLGTALTGEIMVEHAPVEPPSG